VRWPENLARAGCGMWEEVLNFLDFPACRQAGLFRFCVKTKMKARPAGHSGV